jgi:hypothetical protein
MLRRCCIDVAVFACSQLDCDSCRGKSPCLPVKKEHPEKERKTQGRYRLTSRFYRKRIISPVDEEWSEIAFPCILSSDLSIFLSCLIAMFITPIYDDVFLPRVLTCRCISARGTSNVTHEMSCLKILNFLRSLIAILFSLSLSLSLDGRKKHLSRSSSASEGSRFLFFERRES